MEHIKLRRNWVDQVFYSSYNSKSRGVAILLHRFLPFTLDKTTSDKEGHYVLLFGYLYGEHVIFGCIYSPTIYEASFIPQLISDLAKFSSPYLLLGGDFNYTPNPNITKILSVSRLAFVFNQHSCSVCRKLQGHLSGQMLWGTASCCSTTGWNYTVYVWITTVYVCMYVVQSTEHAWNKEGVSVTLHLINHRNVYVPESCIATLFNLLSCKNQSYAITPKCMTIKDVHGEGLVGTLMIRRTVLTSVLPLCKERQTLSPCLFVIVLFSVEPNIHHLDRDCTFFSNPHQVFSRVEYFLSSRTVLGRILNCTIDTKFLSDHSPIRVTISPPCLDPACRHWRLAHTLLSNHSFIEYITSEWQKLISLNKTPDIGPSTLWEAGKAYICGAIISYTSAQKKDALKRQLDLEKTIKNLEAQFNKSHSSSLAKQLDAARSALNQLLNR